MAKKSKTRKSKVKPASVIADLARIARLMRSAEHEIGLNPAQWEALRFLAHCNDESNSPIALTRYLGATKGTISQTIITLVNKGLVEKKSRKGERRSVALTVTQDGLDLLAEDPWQRIEKSFRKLGPKKQSRTAAALAAMLEDELAHREAQGLSAWRSAHFFDRKKKKK